MRPVTCLGYDQPAGTPSTAGRTKDVSFEMTLVLLGALIGREIGTNGHRPAQTLGHAGKRPILGG